MFGTWWACSICGMHARMKRPATLPGHNPECSDIYPKARNWNKLFLKKRNLLFKRPRSASRGHHIRLRRVCTEQRRLASRSKPVDVFSNSVCSERASLSDLHTKCSNFITKLKLPSILCSQTDLGLSDTFRGGLPIITYLKESRHSYYLHKTTPSHFAKGGEVTHSYFPTRLHIHGL